MPLFGKSKKNKREVVDNSEIIPDYGSHGRSVDPTPSPIIYPSRVRVRCTHCNDIKGDDPYWNLPGREWMQGLTALIHRQRLQSLAQQGGPKGEGWKALKKYLEGVKEENRVIELCWHSCQAEKSRIDAFKLIKDFLGGTHPVHEKDFLSFVGGLQPELGVDFDIDDHTDTEGLIRFSLFFV